MTQRGPHTWDIIIQYHRCSKCGNIIESREDYENRLGKYVKDLVCPRCGDSFSVTKKVTPRFGPLMGEPEHVEFDWDQ